MGFVNVVVIPDGVLSSEELLAKCFKDSKICFQCQDAEVHQRLRGMFVNVQLSESAISVSMRGH